jgi:hypothetical protein
MTYPFSKPPSDLRLRGTEGRAQNQCKVLIFFSPADVPFLLSVHDPGFILGLAPECGQGLVSPYLLEELQSVSYLIASDGVEGSFTTLSANRNGTLSSDIEVVEVVVQLNCF